jgi:hypothetical protein
LPSGDKCCSLVFGLLFVAAAVSALGIDMTTKLCSIKWRYAIRNKEPEEAM